MAQKGEEIENENSKYSNTKKVETIAVAQFEKM